MYYLPVELLKVYEGFTMEVDSYEEPLGEDLVYADCK